MFRTPIAAALVAVFAVAGFVRPAAADSATFTSAQKSEIERLVHDYLVKNPEVLVEAMTELRARQERAETEGAQKALVDHHAELYNDPNSPVLGNPAGDVTVIEFFDYSCPYCKSVEDNLKALLQADGKVRLVLKEFPVLGQGSVMAAQAALASRAQNGFAAFHAALLTNRGQFSEESLMRVASSVGLDTARLKKDMGDKAIEAALAANAALADELNIHGTPAFIIGGKLYPGVIDLKTMQKAVAEARKSRG